MEIVKCSKGHFYDKSLGQCPVCAQEAAQNGGVGGMNRAPVESFSETVPLGGGFAGGVGETAPVSNYGETVPLGGGFSGGVGETVPMGGGAFPGGAGETVPMGGFNGFAGATQPDPNGGFGPSIYTPNNGGSKFQVEEYNETQPVSINQVQGFDPVVGWLICIAGPNRGKDYRLHSGTNFIGRSRDNDVCIENDDSISKKNAASVSYDQKHVTFYITKGGEVRNLIYLNEQPVLTSEKIKAYDEIEIGNTTLKFIPLCSEEFNW